MAADAPGTATFTLTVTDVIENAPPTLSVPPPQTAYEDVDKPISGITVGDPDGGNLTVTLAVGHGKLTLGTTAGITITGGGNGTAMVRFTGSITNLNAALATLVYRGGLNYSGADTLSITASDGSLSTGGSVAITVKSAAQQAADLRAQVAALRTAGVLNRGQANMLTSDLNLRGTSGDIGKVQQFLADVAGLRTAGVLTPAQADALLGPGNTLLLSVTRR